jgi:ribA/ribD-fused uncharacterized protein
MKYTVEKLINENSNLKFLFFWGHQPSKDGSITKACFSQWYESSFKVDEITYKTAEHWMMAKKAALFNDLIALQKIVEANTAAEAKKLGREVLNYDETTWLKHRFEIVKEGNWHKFNQNKQLGEFLLNTKNRVLVEASPVDAIWGIGMASDHDNINNPSAWRGLNLLGFALMEVRDNLEQ